MKKKRESCSRYQWVRLLSIIRMLLSTFRRAPCGAGADVICWLENFPFTGEKWTCGRLFLIWMERCWTRRGIGCARRGLPRVGHRGRQAHKGCAGDSEDGQPLFP